MDSNWYTTPLAAQLADALVARAEEWQAPNAELRFLLAQEGCHCVVVSQSSQGGEQGPERQTLGFALVRHDEQLLVVGALAVAPTVRVDAVARLLLESARCAFPGKRCLVVTHKNDRDAARLCLFLGARPADLPNAPKGCIFDWTSVSPFVPREKQLFTILPRDAPPSVVRGAIALMVGC